MTTPSSPSDTKPLSLATRSLTADHHLATGREVAPNISLTTTFRHLPPDEVIKEEWDPQHPKEDVYSRYTQPTMTRAEAVLTSVIGQPTILFPSGIAATFACLVHTRPNVIAITKGYHGCHESIQVYRRLLGEDNVRVILLDDDYTLKASEKLLCWLETPLNPTGECRDIAYYAKKTHDVGGILAIDSTFGPPPLQDPFKWGADMVMHSATKYFAGHSDALGGTLSVRTDEEWKRLWHLRTYTGSNLGSLEAWLTLRSLRTLELVGQRVNRQSTTATALAFWLNTLTRSAPGSNLDGPGNFLLSVFHASLQDNGRYVGVGRQMESGSPTFAIVTTKPEYAAWLGHRLEIFTPATSLGGVESLIEHRIVSDPTSDPCLIRLSIGVESFEDLKQDLMNGMNKVLAKERGGTLKL